MAHHKRCNHCKRELATTLFSKNSRQADQLDKRCKECQSELSKKYMDKKREAIREYNRNWARNRRVHMRALVLEYKQQRACVDCAESDPDVLEFDHVRGEKCGDINGLVRHLRNDVALLAEIAKCEVRCANCHRRKTARERHI